MHVNGNTGGGDGGDSGGQVGMNENADKTGHEFEMEVYTADGEALQALLCQQTGGGDNCDASVRLGKHDNITRSVLDE